MDRQTSCKKPCHTTQYPTPSRTTATSALRTQKPPSSLPNPARLGPISRHPQTTRPSTHALDPKAQSLSTLVLERNLQKAAGANGNGNALLGASFGGALGASQGPAVTYTNIESAPSLHAAKKHYCDITGLPARYTDPKTKLRYHNQEMFGVVRILGSAATDQYLAARGANVILK